MADVTVQGPKCNEISDYNKKLIHNIIFHSKSDDDEMALYNDVWFI